MRTQELAEIVAERYRQADKNEMTTQIRLFGIEFAEELEGHSLAEICALADLKASYAGEIRKGMKLAPYVLLRK
jgi:hypothetical protein